MTPHKIFPFTALLFVHGFCLSQPGDTLRISLDEAWQKAEAHSRQIAITRKNTEIASEEEKNAELERLPEFGVSGSAELASNMPIYANGIFSAPTDHHEVIHNLYKVGADFYLNLYNGNKVNLAIEASRLLHQIAEVRHDETVSNIRYRVSALYLDLQRSTIFRDLIIRDIADQEKQLKEIESFHKNGTVLKSDVLRVRLDLSRRKMSLVTIENDILIATQKINILIGEPDSRVIRTADFDTVPAAAAAGFDNYLSLALAHSFAYHISESQTALRKTNLQQAKSGMSPKIGLYGDYWYANPQIFLYPYNAAWYSLGITGVKVSMPISALYHDKHKVQAARLELEKEEEAHRDVADKIRQQVWEAYLRYKESLVQIGVATENVTQAEENARIIKNTYFSQSSLITDLLDADIQVLRTRFELAEDRIKAQDKFYYLENIVGILNHEK